MNLHDLVTQVSQETGLPMQDVKRVIQASFGTIVKTVAADEDVVLVGFGKFALKHNAARQGRNPATGEMIDIPPSRGMRFAPGKPVKDTLNPPEEPKALPAAKPKKQKTA
ncbi:MULTISPECIES: HU family DNA-binding protein [Asaia]|uniref:HU DNA-binding protein n=1 Tax=Asaia bogorensis TaxID=91915 RepID=A0A060QCS0_9PROT|nr:MULTISPECIES: HU family DNA-binding protein [Asaia]ETC99476.1 hypothetical protein P792_03290 [Asaia sp. SF2.1]CDG38944.1 HU DNA-binding protein [Asaia bogorensis]